MASACDDDLLDLVPAEVEQEVKEDDLTEEKGAAADIAEFGLNELEKVAPKAVQGYVKTARDAVQPASDWFELHLPKFLKAYDLVMGVWAKTEQYRPLDFGGIVLGVLMVFFGGTFGATIAAVETFRALAWEDTLAACHVLWEQYKVADEAAEKDESANPIQRDEAAKRDAELRRRAFVIFKSIDPDVVSKALGAIWSGFFGVVCALRVKFAHVVSLGISLGDMSAGLFHRYAEPQLVALFPESLHKWVPVLSRWFCRALSVSLAWALQIIIVAFHSALRGANLVVSGVAKVLVERKMVDKEQLPDKESAEWNAAVYTVTAVGFYFQCRWGFSVPFPFNLVTWPISIVEFCVKLVIGTYGM